MATKHGKVVRYNRKLPSIKSHDLSITWSNGFDYLIRFVGLDRKRLSCH